MKSVKNIYYIIFIGLFLLYLSLIIFAFTHLDSYTNVNSNAVDNITVVIDAGHGGEDGGAVANDIVEKDINLSIANKLAEILRFSGFNVVTTRSTDTMINTDGDSISGKKLSDMKNRLAMFNSNENNIVVSIHQNKFPQEKYSGTQIFYSQNNENSLKLADCIKRSVNSLLQPENNRENKPASKDIYLLYNSTVPALIVECGFISNYNEAEKLKTEEYQNMLAYSVYIGILDYCNKADEVYYGKN